MDVSKNSGTPKSSILVGFSIINHPFWGTPILRNTHIGSLPTNLTVSDPPTSQKTGHLFKGLQAFLLSCLRTDFWPAFKKGSFLLVDIS